VDCRGLTISSFVPALSISINVKPMGIRTLPSAGDDTVKLRTEPPRGLPMRFGSSIASLAIVVLAPTISSAQDSAFCRFLAEIGLIRGTQKVTKEKEPTTTYFPVPEVTDVLPSIDGAQLPKARKIATSKQREWDAPFQQLPEVTTVPGASDRDAIGFIDNEDLPKPLGHYTFDKAAHFPMPGFDLEGCPADRAGVVIYEGMRVSLRKGGEFDVKMNVTIPDRPVTLRIQLKVFVKNAQPGNEGAWIQNDRLYTLTLPAIELNPIRRTADLDLGPPPLRDVGRLTFHVSHEGYSALLEDVEDEFRQTFKSKKDVRLVQAVEIYRDGTARFGTTPPRLFAR
jgi:hypothetical protein